MRFLKGMALIVIMMSFLLPTTTTYAETGISITIDFPLTDKLKYDMDVPVTATITNTGTDFDGDLALTTSTDTIKTYPLRIAKGEEKTIELMIESYILMPENKDTLTKRITLYPGGIEKQEKTKASVAVTKTPQMMAPNTPFILTVTSNEQRLINLLKSVKQIDDVTTITTRASQLPTDYLALATFNYMIIDDSKMSQLSEEQQQALKSWVQRGGHLITSTSEADETAWGAFNGLMPLKVGNKDQVNVEGATVTYYQTSLNDKAQELVNKYDIQIAQRHLGSGSIIQLPFVLGDEAIQNNEAFYEWLISKMDLFTHAPMNTLTQDQSRNELSNNTRVFPTLEISATTIITALVVYIFIVGPLLYWLLRRRGKSGYAWFVIPLIAIITAVAIFLIGAKDRIKQPSTQQLATYFINDDESVQGVYAMSLLTNSLKDVAFSLDDDTTVNAIDTLSFTSGSTKNYVKDHTLIFSKPSYWSVQTFSGNSFVSNVGKLTIDVVVSDGRIEGTVHNGFSFDFKQATLWSGSEQVVLGDIKPNETLIVSQPLKSPYLKPVENNGTIVQRNPGSLEEIVAGQKHAQETQLNLLAPAFNKPIIFGSTNQSLTKAQFKGEAKEQHLTYLAQAFEPRLELKGDFSISDKEMKRTIINEQSDMEVDLAMPDANEAMLEGQVNRYELTLPKEMVSNDVGLQQVIVTEQDSNTKSEILNNVTNEYEVVDGTWKQQGNINPYVNRDGVITLRVSLLQETGVVVKLPTVQIMGVAQ